MDNSIKEIDTDLKRISKKPVRTYKDLIVFNLAYSSAMKIFNLSKGFIKEEKYSLTNQIRRSSRSIPANIAEGWAKRRYKNVFLRHLVIANGSCEETKIWLDFAKDCNYISKDKYLELHASYCETGAMINSLINNWQSF